MSSGTWRRCLRDILFPMLDQVRRLAGEASAEVTAGQQASRTHTTCILQYALTSLILTSRLSSGLSTGARLIAHIT